LRAISDLTQGPSKFEHAEDLRVSTLRECLDSLGARLEPVAVFDEEDRWRRFTRRVPRRTWCRSPAVVMSDGLGGRS